MDVADGRFYHVVGINGGHRDLVAYEGDIPRFLYASAHNAQTNAGAFFAAKFFHDGVARHVNACYRLAINGDNAVAWFYTGFLAGAVLGGCDNYEGVVKHVKLHTDASKSALQRFVEPTCFFSVAVTAVRIELFKDAGDGVFYHRGV